MKESLLSFLRGSLPKKNGYLVMNNPKTGRALVKVTPRIINNKDGKAIKIQGKTYRLKELG